MSRSVFLLLVPAFLSPVAASAAIFNPATSADLQTALTTAATSAEDDVINLQSGTTYFTSGNSNATYNYNSTNNGSLTITGAGAGSSILDGDSARQVLKLVSTGATASFQLSALTIRNGTTGDVAGVEVQGVDGDQSLTDCEILNNIEGGGVAGGIGGVALHNNGTGNQIIANCRIQGNSGGNVGGAQMFTTGNIQFNDNVVTGNEISSISPLGLIGGAVMTSLGTASTVVARGNEIRNNTGDSVSGIYLSSFNGATLTLEDNLIADNQNPDADVGGAKFQTLVNSPELIVRSNVITGNSGSLANGVQLQNNANGNIILESNTIRNNENDDAFGGGVQLQNNGTGSITVFGNTIDGNTGDFATGIQIQNNQNGPVTFESNILSNNVNTQSEHGGAQIQHNGTGDLRIVNNLVFGNSAASQGGGLSIFSASETLTFVNNTIVGNSVVANDGVGGGGVLLTPLAGMVTANFYNNILFGNSAAPANTGNDLLVDIVIPGIQLFNNDFSQACFGPAPANCDLATVAGLNQGENIDADPLFVNAEAGNFQLGPDSPALDAGDTEAPGLPDLDLAGNPRVFNGRVDMGSFEAQPLLTADPATLDFGFVGIGEEESQILTIGNAGVTAVAVGGIQLSDSTNYELDLNAGDNPCGSSSFSLNPGESCSMAVVFGPSAEGELDANLQIDTDSAIPTVVELIGSGQGGGGSGGCSLGAATMSRGFLLALLVPISAIALVWRRRR